MLSSSNEEDAFTVTQFFPSLKPDALKVEQVVLRTHYIHSAVAFKMQRLTVTNLPIYKSFIDHLEVSNLYVNQLVKDNNLDNSDVVYYAGCYKQR